jgi:hypothetical protein
MFEPRQVEITTLIGADDFIVEKRPFVTLFEEGLLRNCRPGFTPEALGYRRVSRDPFHRLTLYARPWVLWAILRLDTKMREFHWAVFDRLYKRGIIHVRTREGMRARWRDLGLGPTPKRG